MSAVMGALKNVGFCSEMEKDQMLEESGGIAGPSGDGRANGCAGDDVGKLRRKSSHASICSTDGDDGEDDVDGDDDGGDESTESKGEAAITLGPQCTLKEQIEKDKEDESLRRWKEQLLGSVDLTAVGEALEPEVKIMSLTILSPGRPDLHLPIPLYRMQRAMLSRLKMEALIVSNSPSRFPRTLFSGLKYTNTVWKTGMRVDSTRVMLGTFSPQQEPYTYELEEETTPSGIFARGSYSARTKFVDDDGKVYLNINYSFEIRKEWA